MPLERQLEESIDRVNTVAKFHRQSRSFRQKDYLQKVLHNRKKKEGEINHKMSHRFH